VLNARQIVVYRVAVGIVAPNPLTPFPLREGGEMRGSPPLYPAWGYAPNPLIPFPLRKYISAKRFCRNCRSSANCWGWEQSDRTA